ncbi:MAG TPA: PAS domain S-box protein [Verrucomicrobiae bacterium]|nr:PAS domain S-box protein [Verrucomicrobiae bacterium]
MRNDRIRVLMIEEGVSVADLIAQALNRPRATAREAAQFSVERASTLDAAVKRLEVVGFDVALVGLRRNNGTDIQRLVRLHKEFSNTLLVAIMDTPDERLAVAGSSVGAVECFSGEQIGFLPQMLECLVGRQRAEEKLAQREEDFEVLIKHTSDITTLIDADANICYVSPSAEPMLGYSPDQLRGQKASMLIHPEDQDITKAVLADALQRPLHPITTEVRFRHNAGHWVHLEAVGRNVPNAEGLPQLVFNARDISARRQAEAALRESEARFRQLAESIGEIFWLTTPEGRVIYVSPAYEKIWGVPCKSSYAAPHAWLGSIHSEDRERVSRALQILRRGGEYNETYRILRPDGTLRWIHDQASPVRNEPGEIYRIAGVARDVTGQRELEEQVRQMQKLDSIGHLAAGIAHDFNNVLAVVQGHADFLLKHESLSPKVTESIKEIAMAGERAAKLTRQLMAFGRKQVMQIQTIDLNQVITGFSKMLESVLGNQTILTRVLSPVPAPVQADTGMMEQVLMNLAVNARDAMRDGGQLRITTTLVDVDTNFVRRTPEAAKGEHVCLSVTDTGCGIPAEILPSIFEPFFTTKEKDRGTGLGLAIVYGIVKQHGGWIDVESTPGQGTTFQIYIPSAVTV